MQAHATHLTHFTHAKRAAFTLAEVLITLGIIGVVAAMTIPTLISSYKEKQTVVKVQKAFSVFKNVYQYTLYEYGTPDKWNLHISAEDTQKFFDKLKPYLRLTKECGFNNREECGYTDEYFINFDGSSSISNIHNGFTKVFVLSDGTSVLLYIHHADGPSGNPGCAENDNYFPCAEIDIKTDSSKKQIYGKNVFSFRLEHDRIVPYGSGKFGKDMSKCYGDGRYCTAWVIENKNMDYLHCDDLSWNGKHKCSD